MQRGEKGKDTGRGGGGAQSYGAAAWLRPSASPASNGPTVLGLRLAGGQRLSRPGEEAPAHLPALPTALGTPEEGDQLGGARGLLTHRSSV